MENIRERLFKKIADKENEYYEDLFYSIFYTIMAIEYREDKKKATNLFNFYTLLKEAIVEYHKEAEEKKRKSSGDEPIVIMI